MKNKKNRKCCFKIFIISILLSLIIFLYYYSVFAFHQNINHEGIKFYILGLVNNDFFEEENYIFHDAKPGCFVYKNCKLKWFVNDRVFEDTLKIQILCSKILSFYYVENYIFYVDKYVDQRLNEFLNSIVQKPVIDDQINSSQIIKNDNDNDIILKEKYYTVYTKNDVIRYEQIYNLPDMKLHNIYYQIDNNQWAFNIYLKLLKLFEFS